MTRIEEIQQKATEAGDARFRRNERERNAYVLGRIHGGLWADHTMLNNVCEWLEDNIYDYLYINRDFNEADYKHELIEDLRKAMEE